MEPLDLTGRKLAAILGLKGKGEGLKVAAWVYKTSSCVVSFVFYSEIMAFRGLLNDRLEEMGHLFGETIQ